MPEQKPSVHVNTYNNAPTGAIPNPLAPNPGIYDEEFAAATNQILQNAGELARVLIGAHQSAVAIIVGKDWNTVRKWFSLSEKYADFSDFDTPADGEGTHGWLLHHNKPVRMTHAELAAHAEWKEFGDLKERHPPMRGWMAAPLVFKDGSNWGLFQLSDKYEGEFTAEDEAHFVRFTALVSQAIEALWDVRNLRVAVAAEKASAG